MFRKIESVLATVTGLLLFTFNELRLFNSRPHALDAAHGYVHPAFVRVFGTPQQFYLSTGDLAVRWSLVALTVALAIWALADSIDRRAVPSRTR
jgi:hypothetical protein